MPDDRTLVIGVDVGGTNLRFAAVDRNGMVLERVKIPTACDRDGFLCQMGEYIRMLSEKALESGYSIGAAGIGMPGLISPSGEIRSSVNLPHCEGMNLQSEVQNLTGLPVISVNDANAAAYGEYRFGAGRSFRTFMMITIGTGIGGGLIIDGRLWSGTDGFAGEFGHLTVVPEGMPCPCGNSGCVEKYSSATAILAGALSEGILTGSAPSLESLAALAVDGNPAAIALFEQAGHYLGSAASTVVNLLNPEAIIVGGGVAASFPLFYGSMRKEIDKRSYKASAERLTLLRSQLSDDAGVLGAAATAFESFGSSQHKTFN